MLKAFHTLLAIGAALLATSCAKSDPNDHLDEGSIADNTYTSDEIGWTMEIPSGWKMLSRKEIEGYQEKGGEMLTETLGEDIEYEGLKNLLNFRKDDFNVFQSTSEPFVVEYEGEWEESNQFVRALLVETYENQGIQTTSTEIATEVIDGVTFQHFDVSILAPTGEVIITQAVYGSLINGYAFGVAMTYNSAENRDAMLSALRNSKFSKKHTMLLDKPATSE